MATTPRPARRPTIADIAARAGLTKAAVSFALNNQPGVSQATRERVLAIAREIGWQPNSAARALTDGRAGAFGLVIDRPAGTLGVEPFFMQLVAGIQGELAEERSALLFTVAEDYRAEIELHRTWWAQRRVDGVLLVDLHVHDPRVAALEELGLPAVVVGAPEGSGTLPAVFTDEAANAQVIVEHLAELGHTRIGHVTGMAELWHTRLRAAALARAAGQAGIETESVAADYTAEAGAQATRTLLGRASRPTAVVYDNDLMAVSGLGEAQRMGLEVPGQLAIAAWYDSVLCHLVNPPLTALSTDVGAYGARAARALIERTAGGDPGHRREPAATLAVRGSTRRG
ncbi:LacI family DNA-binding transcriptional regulator [Actinospica durhamensis]|uniref:LacI family DNA-binding transcriptional regulator n=1 Tax=Actinospica durhamensis TaxID=1508375 RepID=A0A941EZQ3_9ACTN|nr:LacI family DNA-binding transcriptional regulator [Actinospica durhamensis]MBR7839677.1 LacI family DNA-binding transcriptional regulator [Actinospica durhamensis]